jgi:hypothetical protein
MSIKPKGAQFTLNAGDMDKPVQLPMFMPAQELRDSLTATADLPSYSVDEVFDIKLTDSMRCREAGAHGSGVFSSVQEKGVLNPVQLIHGDNDLMMGQGHHRAAAADFDAGLPQPGGKPKDQWLPLVHTDKRGQDLFDVDTRRSAMQDMGEFTKNTGAYYRGPEY